jgi:SAM-dependent methyltransferase
MTIAQEIRRVYERRPYPFGNAKALKGNSWDVYLEWINAIGRGKAGTAGFDRVLFAGCGDGNEAFSLRRRLPRAEIVAIDFSTRSIAVAQRLQRRSKLGRSIRFLVADLTDPRLPAKLGEFDLILCHGVLSYVPAVQRALNNFARCLRPEGVLYLGVNGSAHVSTRLRRALPAFGFDLNSFADGPRLRAVMGLCDGLLAADRLPKMAGFWGGYLASDVFGPLNRSLSLAEWTSRARRAGLSLRGTLASVSRFRTVAEAEAYPLLMPRSRAQVAELLELLRPSEFHRVIFSRRAESNPPWDSRRRLLKWRVAPTRLFRIRLPKASGKARDRLRDIRMGSADLGLHLEWRMPEWQLELLRGGDGTRSLGSQLDRMALAVPFPDLRKQLYLLYQLGVITLLPPAASA